MEGKLKIIIDSLVGRSESEVLQILSNHQDLSSKEKNFIWTYLFPKPLQDYELPRVVGPYLESTNGGYGYWTIDFRMILHLVRAARCSQYKNFMRHLIHSFIRSTPFPVSGHGHGKKCPICGKILYEYDFWKERCEGNNKLSDEQKKNYLAYGSNGSDIQLCLPCLIHLEKLDKILDMIETGYLNKGDRFN